MSDDRICPLNQRICGCDPNATDDRARPCARSKRLAKLIRMFGSSFKTEQRSAFRMLQQFMRNEAVTFNDIGVIVEEKQYTIEQARFIYQQGKEKGRDEEARQREAPPEFYDADGHPRWNEIALFCQKNSAQLRDEWERTFVNDMAGKTLWREPSEKQAKHLIAIFVRLGGYYDPKATNLCR
jgi:hypothetical protein